MRRVWACAGCPCNGVCHEVDDSPCDACAIPKAASPAPVAPKVGDMMSFLATDRAMGNLSAAQRIMDAPQARELWGDEAFRKLIAGEWKVLKELMKEAGFE